MSFGFLFQPPSEEEQRAMREAHERHEMHMDDFRHGFQRLFEELGEDQLGTLKMMFHLLCDRTNDSLAAHWEGMISWELKRRFGICVTCGKNHDEELTAPTEEHPLVKEAENTMRPLTEAEKFFSTPEEIAADEDQTLPIFLGSLNEDQIALMKEYHLDDVYDGETQELLHFACTGIQGMKQGCGVTYPSIEDRMLKGPEECSGCFSRMAQG
jgi:hypothetical protein